MKEGGALVTGWLARSRKMAHRICKRQLWIVSGRVVVEMKKSTYQTLETDIMPHESATNENFG